MTKRVWRNRGDLTDRYIDSVYEVKLVEYYAEKHTPLPIAKPLEFRSGRTNPIPFIKLFGFPDHKLPIERIIVEPSANKELNANAVRKLVEGEAIEVTVSETPFV